MAKAPALERVTVDEAVTDFLRRMQRLAKGNSLSKNTVDAYTYDLKEFATIAADHMDSPTSRLLLDDIGAEDLDEIVLAYQDTPDHRYTKNGDSTKTRSATSAIRFRNTIGKLFKTADRLNWIEYDPFPDTEHKPKRDTELAGWRKALSRDAAEQLVATTEAKPASKRGAAAGTDLHLRDTLIIRILMESGPRVSELCALNIDDVRQNHRNDNLGVDNFLEIRRGKRGKSRSIPLSPETWNSYLDYRDNERPSLLAKGTRNSPTQQRDAETALFLSFRGRRLTPRSVQKRIDELSRANGTRITPHGLRHTAATLLLEGKDGSLPAVRDILGHEDITTTGGYIDSRETATADAVRSHPVTGES